MESVLAAQIIPSAAAGAADRRQPPGSSHPWSVPQVLLAAYRKAVAGAPPHCHLPVNLLAAIGQVESGSLSGRSIDAGHRAVPPVLGPLLDGAGTAVIRDSDGGRLDGSTHWDRAVGPMQFIPSTWAMYGIDGDRNGRADPQDVYDAAASAAGYLCAGGRDLARASGLRSAILSYNHSTAYLATVLTWQSRFAATGGRTGEINTINTINSRSANATKTSPNGHFANATRASIVDHSAKATRMPPTALPTLPRTGTAIQKGTRPPIHVIIRNPSKMTFTKAPSPTTTSGTALATQPVVTVQDSAGHIVPTDTRPVTLRLTEPAGATLTCDSNPQVARSGIATFIGCSVDRAGTYTLTASDGSLTAATSAKITVTAGHAAKLAFIAEPSPAATSGTALVNQPVVAVQDAAGNIVTTDTSSVTLTLKKWAGVTLACTSNTQATKSGIASFAGCAIDKAGAYTLNATDGSLTAAASTGVTIIAGVPAAVAVVLGSGQSAIVGGEFTSPLVARVTDANANPVPGVILTFIAPASPAGPSATFAGSTPATSALTGADGRAISSAITANTISGSYSLIATAGSVRATAALANSPAVATKFAFTSKPLTGSASATATLGPITVQLQDRYGNPVRALAEGTKATLASDSAGSSVFTSTLSGTSIGSLAIPIGKSSATFYYGDTRPGNPLITASGPLISATQRESVTA